jgi:hypothetical protein|tara:strand:- start:2180 stop:2584 length:405 start_codon:yes stop_codon:yes gene_type:complete
MPIGDDLAAVAEQLRQWREQRVRGQRIPERLWQAAVALSERHSLQELASTLGLDSARLKRRVEGEPAGFGGRKAGSAALPGAGFVELGRLEAGSPDECRVEVEDGEGRKLRMHLRGSGCALAVEIAKAVWSSQR